MAPKKKGKAQALYSAQQLVSSPQHLAEVLTGIANAKSGNEIKIGEATLKPFLKLPDAVPSLLNIINSVPDDTVKLQGALALKRSIKGCYKVFNAQQKLVVKNMMLNLCKQLTTINEVNVFMRSIAAAFAKLAKAVLDEEGKWEDLFNLLTQLVSGETENHIKVCYVLLIELEEEAHKHMKSYATQLCNMYLPGINSSNSKLADIAVEACATSITRLRSDKELESMSPCVMPVMQLLIRSVTEDNIEMALTCLDMFSESAQATVNFMNDHIPHLIQVTLNILREYKKYPDLCDSSATVIYSLIDHRPKLLAKHNLVVPLLSGLIEIMSKFEDNTPLFQYGNGDDDDDDDDDVQEADNNIEEDTEMSSRIQYIVDRMSIKIASKHFTQPALNHVSTCLTQPDKKLKRAGVAVLAVMIEGSCDALKPLLENILPSVLQLVEDSDAACRENACFAIAQFAEFCNPQITYHSDAILSTMVKYMQITANYGNNQVMDKKTKKSVFKAIEIGGYVLEQYIENLLDSLFIPYLNDLMAVIDVLLTKYGSYTNICDRILSVIAASAIASEKGFIPYIDVTLQLLRRFLFETDKNKFDLRGKSLEVLGHVAIAVGQEHFRAHFEVGYRSAWEGLDDQLDVTDTLKEFSYLYFANAGKVMLKEMSPYLQQLVPKLMIAVTLSEYESQDDDDEVEYDDDGKEIKFINIDDAYINSKKASITTLASLAEACEEEFAPYLDVVWPALINPNPDAEAAINSNHPNIQSEVFASSGHFLRAAMKQGGVMTTPEAGEIINIPAVLHEPIDVLYGICIRTIYHEEDPDLVYSAIDGLSEVIKLTGSCVFNRTIRYTRRMEYESGNTETLEGVVGELLNQALLMLIQEKAPCQINHEEQDEDEEDETDSNLLIIITELLGRYALALGREFNNVLSQFVPTILKLASVESSSSQDSQSSALGCLGEIMKALGPLTIQYIDQLAPVIKIGLEHSDSNVRRNAAYCMARLYEYNGSDMSKQSIEESLVWLFPLASQASVEGQRLDVRGADVDNAVSAVAHICRTNPNAAPISQILPVMVAALPLKSDLEEGENIFSLLTQLIDQGEPTALSFYAQILDKIHFACSDQSKHEDELKNKLKSWKNGKIQAQDGGYIQASGALRANNNEAAYIFLSTIN